MAAGGSGGHAASAAPAAHASSGGGGYRSAASTSGLHSGFSGTTSIASYQRGFGSGGVRTVPSVAANPGFSSYGTIQSGTTGTRTQVARANNAWTDPVSPRVAANARTGTNLYAGAYGYMPTRPASGHLPTGQNGRGGPRGNRRFYYNNFPYGVYYPYLYGNEGYGGYGNDGYDLGAADYAGSVGSDNDADLGAPNFSNTPNNYYSYVSPDPGNPGASSSAPTQPLPEAPAVGPQTPSADSPTAAAQGPDSLVEAVQTELARRGYFEGKADSMYSDATKEAIRRFQTDQRLPATGRINEATLHALRLD